MCFNCAESIQQSDIYIDRSCTLTHTNASQSLTNTHTAHIRNISLNFSFPPCAISECFPTCFELTTIALTLSRCVYLLWLPVEKSFPCLSFVRSLCVFASIYITVLYCRRRCFPSFAVALFYTSFLLPRSMYVAMYSRSTHLQHSFSVNGNEMRARTERPLSCTRLVHIVCRIYIYVPYEWTNVEFI